jgi:hypothetical protein
MALLHRHGPTSPSRSLCLRYDCAFDCYKSFCCIHISLSAPVLTMFCRTFAQFNASALQRVFPSSCGTSQVSLPSAFAISYLPPPNPPTSPRTFSSSMQSFYHFLIQGLWSNWQLWRQRNKGEAGAFGNWVKSSCGLKGFDVLMEEVASVLCPQLLHHRLPPSAEQVQLRLRALFGQP